MAAVLECCDDVLTVEFLDQCEFQDSDVRLVTIENVQSIHLRVAPARAKKAKLSGKSAF